MVTGIITNAKIHRNKRIIVNVDLSDFFDSIHIGRVCGFFEKNKHFNLPHEPAITIAQLACYQGKLPQGAPTSPIITNLICQVLDMHLLSFAKRYRLDYTRYADDITFSGKRGISTIIPLVEQIVEEEGFLVNQNKTRLQYNNQR